MTQKSGSKSDQVNKPDVSLEEWALIEDAVQAAISRCQKTQIDFVDLPGISNAARDMKKKYLDLLFKVQSWYPDEKRKK